jgi:hypothetical protein
MTTTTAAPLLDALQVFYRCLVTFQVIPQGMSIPRPEGRWDPPETTISIPSGTPGGDCYLVGPVTHAIESTATVTEGGLTGNKFPFRTVFAETSRHRQTVYTTGRKTTFVTLYKSLLSKKQYL